MLADVVTFIHVASIVLVLAGIPLSVEHKKLRPFEIILLLGTIFLWSLYGNCPFTILEAHLRGGAVGAALLQKGFIPYYLGTFGLAVNSKLVHLTIYTIAIIFLILCAEWEWPAFKRFTKQTR